MNLRDLELPDPQRDVASRFLELCLADPRIVAAFIGGSHARGQADEYSDLDLYFVTTDEAYEDFVTDKARFAHQLGRLLFLEDFGEVHGSLFVHENGTEGEFWFGRQSDFQAICRGPYTVLFDRLDLLEGGEFPAPAADHERQLEVLRRQIDWFWHELSHFIKAMGRRQWWFAYGQVEAMRRMCVMLARLDHDFTDTAAVESEPYFKSRSRCRWPSCNLSEARVARSNGRRCFKRAEPCASIIGLWLPHWRRPTASPIRSSLNNSCGLSCCGLNHEVVQDAARIAPVVLASTRSEGAQGGYRS